MHFFNIVDATSVQILKYRAIPSRQIVNGSVTTATRIIKSDAKYEIKAKVLH